MKFFESDFSLELRNWLEKMDDIELLKYITYIYILNISDRYSTNLEINKFFPILSKIETILKTKNLTIADLTPYEFDQLVAFIEEDIEERYLLMFCEVIGQDDEKQDEVAYRITCTKKSKQE